MDQYVIVALGILMLTIHIRLYTRMTKMFPLQVRGQGSQITELIFHRFCTSDVIMSSTWNFALLRSSSLLSW